MLIKDPIRFSSVGSTLTLGTSNATYGGYTLTDLGHSHYLVDRERQDRISELEGLTRMYSTLKEASTPQDILASFEDTIRRYTAELYYLEPTK